MSNDTEKIEVPKEQLEALLEEHKELKASIKECAGLLGGLISILGLNDGASFGTLTLKIPQILYKLQKDPDMINKFVEYYNKIQKYTE